MIEGAYIAFFDLSKANSIQEYECKDKDVSKFNQWEEKKEQRKSEEKSRAI